jgi:glyoxylase-like metal-dependent hydrolase (beta-lactamase superfamily II)
VRRIALPREGVPTGSVNAYLHDPPDAPALLVDPGVEARALDEALAGVDVGHVAVTHAHPDHADALARVADETGAAVWAAAGHEARFRATTGVDPDGTLADGDRIAGTRVLATPGHAPDHLAFLAAAGAACGDLVVAEGSVSVAAPGGDVRAYLCSLRRLRLRDPPRLFPGHGPVVDDPRVTVDRLYDHRRERERRVLAAVQAGARDPDAALDGAYDVDLGDLRAQARATVVAHLEKLDAEGRVRWDPASETVEPA